MAPLRKSSLGRNTNHAAAKVRGSVPKNSGSDRSRRPASSTETGATYGIGYTKESVQRIRQGIKVGKLVTVEQEIMLIHFGVIPKGLDTFEGLVPYINDRLDTIIDEL